MASDGLSGHVVFVCPNVLQIEHMCGFRIRILVSSLWCLPKLGQDLLYAMIRSRAC